jgi:hypothetical protein
MYGPSPLSLEAIDRLMADEDDVRADDRDQRDEDSAGSTSGEGLFLRVLVGPTRQALTASSHEGGASSQVRGWGLGVGALAGAWVAPHLVLAGELSLASAYGPEVEGTAVVAPVGPATLSTFTIGGNAIYFIDALAATVSAGAVLSQVRLVDQSTSYVHAGTRLGPGVSFGLYKEWNVSRSFGIGAAARTSVAWPDDRRRGMSVRAVSAGLALSVSYD